eukprot:5538395-Karenia_brevis.AAC.1
MRLFFKQLAKDWTCNLLAAAVCAVFVFSDIQALLMAQVSECGSNTCSSVQDTDADSQNPDSTPCSGP